MSRNYWQQLQDLIRKHAHSHAVYHHMLKFGKELGENNQVIDKEQVKKFLLRCDINQVDYVLTGLLRGYTEGLQAWRVEMLKLQREQRAKDARDIRR